jgi:hypothetical protein
MGSPPRAEKSFSNTKLFDMSQPGCYITGTARNY